MIQPITYRPSYVHFKNNSVVKDIKPEPIPEAIVANGNSSDAIIDYLKEKDKVDKKTQVGVLVTSLALMAAMPLIMVPEFRNKIFKSGSKTKDVTKKFDFSDFTSLKDYNEIPTLEKCKSINKNLKKFLENQISYTKATKEQLEKAGMPEGANRLIMYGPPGSGKTFFSQIFAKSIGADYRKINYKDINKRYIGEHLEHLKGIFDDIINTAQKSPEKKFVINFDEIDSIMSPIFNAPESGHISFKKEERNIFLVGIEELAQRAPNVIFIGTTNASAKGQLDGAALSRFKNIINVDYPEKANLLEAIKAGIEVFPEGKVFAEKNLDALEKLADEMHKRGASFRDLNNVINESKNIYLREILQNKSSSYQLDYLKKALNSLEITDGEAAKRNPSSSIIDSLKSNLTGKDVLGK